MFKSQNFCHIASNNRNQVKVGVFVYRTTDSLATVLTSGYFNDRIIDINLHDLIVHEKVDSADATKVERNLLCVTGRTLENVSTSVIKSKWEGDIEQYIEETFVKKDGTSVMTGPLLMRATDDFKCAVAPYWDGVGFFKLNNNNSVTLMASLEYEDGLTPATDNKYDLGTSSKKWKDARIARVITATINNGYDIAVPVTNSADTLALKSQVDDAANSGEQLYSTGVWYAKMYSATVVPTGAEYDGRNYADFSQVDSDNNPVIKIYTGASGAWTLTETITPPANHNGYITVTSKIWDISEQSGQQGGLVLWSYNSKTFTPYPRIVSFESINITGNSTVVMPATPTPNSIPNKQYVDDLVTNSGTGRNVGDIFFTMRKDSGLNGAVDCNGATYNITDFVGAQSIGDLLEDGKVPYVSLSTYATLLSTQGSVGVFGWDGTGNTTFRVPSLNDVFVETGKAAEIGDYLPAGLPDHTHQAPYGKNDTDNAHAEGTMNPHPATSERYSTIQGYGLNSTLASASNSIYGNSTTVQPESVRYRPMVQLVISATDEAVATCTAITAQVAANTSAINGADYVVESLLPTAQNNYTWYRKYKSGWVEQGGVQTGATSGSVSVSLPVTMADTHYFVQVTSTDKSLFGSGAPDTTTQATVETRGHDHSVQPCRCSWQVSGMAA